MGSLCIYGGNIQDTQQLSALMTQIRQASPNAILALDEEGGDVTRLHYRDGSNQPGNAVLGRLDDPQLTRASARAIAREMRAYGFKLNLAPDADVNTNAQNPVIGVRSFGISPRKVAMHTAAFTVGLQGQWLPPAPSTSPGTATPQRTRTCRCRSSRWIPSPWPNANWPRSPRRSRPASPPS